jgi:hypothetical protein
MKIPLSGDLLNFQVAINSKDQNYVLLQPHIKSYRVPDTEF